ncbi:carboxymuconolactone decarboxylase family protein [Caballeronia sp. DA-9]|uniref:carboxymuconolactone decarboxylase family protein n=1 Tax=Caballeronia sp. DA-9 TaxID=3436237 RepID=UPI003F67A7E5
MQIRLPTFDPDNATADQITILQEIASGPRRNLDGPFLSWIHSPQLAQHAQRLGAFCRYETGLSLRLSELAILITAAHLRSQAEWHIHYPIALKAGLPDHIAESIRRREDPLLVDVDDQIIFEFATQLHRTARVSDDIYQRTFDRFGPTVVVNLVGLLGYYTLVAMTLNVFEVRANGQNELPFSEPA